MLTRQVSTLDLYLLILSYYRQIERKRSQRRSPWCSDISQIGRRAVADGGGRIPVALNARHAGLPAEEVQPRRPLQHEAVAQAS